MDPNAYMDTHVVNNFGDVVGLDIGSWLDNGADVGHSDSGGISLLDSLCGGVRLSSSASVDIRLSLCVRRGQGVLNLLRLVNDFGRDPDTSCGYDFHGGVDLGRCHGISLDLGHCLVHRDRSGDHLSL